MCVCVCVCFYCIFLRSGLTFTFQYLLIYPNLSMAQSAGAVKYTDCFSVEG